MVKKIEILADIQDMLSNQVIAVKVGKAIESAFFIAEIIVVEVSDGSTDKSSTD